MFCEGCDILIMGDFNTDMNSESPYKKQLTRLIGTSNLEYLPLNPTHHTPHSSSLIDLILTNNKKSIKTFGQTAAPGLSKHDLIYCAINLKPPKAERSTILVRDKSKFNQKQFEKDAKKIDWNVIFNEQCINEKIKIFNKLILDLYNTHCPMIEIKPKHLPAPWITPYIRSLMNIRDKMYKQWVKTKCNEIHNKYMFNN